MKPTLLEIIGKDSLRLPSQIHFAIFWKAEIVCTGNFPERKDLKTCSDLARNRSDFYKDYTYSTIYTK